ncbi:glutamate receptor ionotropic, delta-1-like [Panulirus ornatus]|uniref:glutamate receptor ionotropic, delta-1-like n=1 Tax=Panulirus ornatus TaxID=150431 RepID=UPI003A8BFADF
MHLVVAAEQWVPWLRITENEDSRELTYSGIMYNILISLSQALNFTYELRRPPDGLWGVGFPNGTWNGQLGMVKRREVDLALGPFAFNWERYHFACEFTQPIFVDYESVFMQRPGLETDLLALVRPFQWQVWLCLFGVLVLIWFILVLFVHVSPYEKDPVTEEEDVAYNDDVGERRYKRTVRGGHASRSHFIWVIRTMSNQSNPWLPKSDSRRVMTGTWLLSCFIILTLFSSTLTAMLTVPMVKLPIDSTEDLVNQQEVSWAIESGSFLYQILYQAKEGIYKALWDGHSQRITDCYSYRHDIRAGMYAAVCDKMTMKKVMSEDFSETGKCNYYMAREDFKAMPLALAFQHHHHLFSEANERILQLIDNGLVDRWIEEQLPNGTACISPPGSGIAGTKRSLSLNDYFGLISVYAVCVVAWTLVLVVEIAVTGLGAIRSTDL